MKEREEVTEGKGRENEKVLLLEKGKHGFLRMLFGRSGFVILMLVLQFLLLISVFYSLSDTIPYLFGGMIFFELCMILVVLNHTDNSTIKLAWIVLIAIVPAVGAMLYLFVQMEFGHRALKKRTEQIVLESAQEFPKNRELMKRLQQTNKPLYHLAYYTGKAGGYPVYENTAVTYFPSGEEKFEALLRELEAAEHFIFLEYFIVSEGYMWGRVLEILSEKVKSGVEVRMMYDGTCEIARLPHDYPEKLKALGIPCKAFAPLSPFLSTYYNYRDHRKIVVIDGKTAFTGGINLADEYINRRVVYGHWKDTAIMLKGEAVQSFTMMFLQMWNVNERVSVYHKYLVKAPVPEAAGYVLPYGDSPLDDDRVGEMIYLDILNQAQDYVHIMSPYLILDDEMKNALQFAARRGVDVRLILPHIPDKKYAFALAKSHYRELLQYGVKIYEYTPGFVHAKVFVSDDCRGVVGTINLDYRSFYHHFECAAYLEQVPAIAQIEQDFLDTLQSCQRVTMETVKRESLSYKLAGTLLKLVAPLL